MTYSEAIARILTLMTEQGVTCTMCDPSLPPDVLGRYDEPTRSIRVCDTPLARKACFILAHEAGHFIGYRVREKKHARQRERQAFVYGYRVMRLVGLHVSRKDWIKFSREEPSWLVTKNVLRVLTSSHRG